MNLQQSDYISLSLSMHGRSTLRRRPVLESHRTNMQLTAITGFPAAEYSRPLSTLGPACLQAQFVLTHIPHDSCSHHDREDIRDFPKAYTSAGAELNRLVPKGLSNCVNLKSLAWTRDGSLTNEMMEALQNCKALRELEINAHSEGNFSASLLLDFVQIERLLLILPGQEVVSLMLKWTSSIGNTLKTLNLTCKVGLVCMIPIHCSRI